jgi:hypothetical protein
VQDSNLALPQNLWVNAGALPQTPGFSEA